ncbi:MMPL family transporter [Leucobacter viscericola]|uniref:MMPL family transporter n=1 Tax=Leucobacter viscericola TaxID=2714935 RepID=A0A6G7XGP4_9MICO|nr:MMPL family transporter [Leucobacter viscericola]QIK63567.1 MMPL family transporter [Leucobacter viscericola]
MAELLFRVGRWSANHGWRVIGAWVVILALAVGGFIAGFGSLANSFDIPGTASSKVIDELQEKLPDFSGASGLVVIHTDNGKPFSAEQKAEYAKIISEATGDLPDVTSVVDPFASEKQRADQQAKIENGRAQIEQGRTQIEQGQAQLDAAKQMLPADQLAAQQQKLDDSLAELEAQSTQLENGAELLKLASDVKLVSEDGSVAVINVAFNEPRLELSEDAKQSVIDYFDKHGVDGISVDYSTDIAQSVPALFGPAEAIGLVIAAVVLLVMLGSVIAAALPLVTAITGVAIGVLASLAFSGILQMASITPVLGVMLGLAVGIDYSLFIVNRHRRQLAQGMAVKDSIALANGTAGNAVLFAGATVIVALVALNVTGVSFLGVMGTVGAVCIAIAVVIAVTLTPALLGLIGMRVLGRRSRTRLEAKATGGAKAKPMNTVRAILTIVATAVVLLLVAAPVLSMRLGLPDGGSEPKDSTTNNAYEISADAFGEGTNATLLATVKLPAGLSEQDTTATQLEVAKAIDGLDDVKAVVPIAVSDDGTLAAFQVKPAEGPNAESTEKLVHALRDPDVLEGTSLKGAELGVAGQAAINIDISQKLADVLPLYLSVVIGLSLLIMILVFRSLLVPLVATVGFVLSLFATYGALVAVFQWGWLGELFGITTPGPILSFLPVILVGILFGLAMDYQLFLASGMREAYVHGSSARLAVAQGFKAGRSVVIAAALIMVSVFGGFVFTESMMIRSVGFGLAVGVLLDAFIVRLLLMPALMHLLGKSAWWLPKWLDRLLPNVDVEGASLERTHGLHE